MKKAFTIVSLFLAFAISAYSQTRNDDFFPLSIGNQWTYKYNISEWEQLLDIRSSDSGSAVCSIVSKSDAGDSTIWSFKEVRDIVHHVNHYFPPQYDTSYSIKDSTLFDLVEYNSGNHLLVRSGPLNWKSVLPITREFADSATFYRYFAATTDTFTLRSQYPKNASKPFYILFASVQRLMGLTKVSYNSTFPTGYVPTSNHVLKSAVITSIETNRTISLPDFPTLSQNYPNPFNPVTSLRFSIAKQTKATIRVYDLLGRYVDTIFDNFVQPGRYYVLWNASELSTGTYFCVLQANGISKSIKLTLLK